MLVVTPASEPKMFPDIAKCQAGEREERGKLSPVEGHWFALHYLPMPSLNEVQDM